MIEIALALAVVGFALGWAVPFVARIATQRSVAGVSSAAVAITACSAVGWASLGVQQGRAEVIASSAIYLLGCAAALVLGFRYRWQFAWWAAAAAGVALVLAFALGGVGGMGVAVLGFAFGRFGAQVLEVWRAEDVSGVSTVAWVVAGTEGLVWLVAYGGAFAWVWQAALWGAVALGASTVIVVRVARVRRRSPAAPTAGMGAGGGEGPGTVGGH